MSNKNVVKSSKVDYDQLRKRVLMVDAQETNDLLHISKLVSDQPVQSVDEMTPEYMSQLKNFKYARTKRRDVYENRKPLGLFDGYRHLIDFRTDIRWAAQIHERVESNDSYMPWSNFDDIEGGAALREPFFCLLFAVTSISWYFLTLSQNGWKFSLFSVNPTVGACAEALAATGAKYSYKIVVSGEIFRLVTPIFMHSGLLHLFFNLKLLLLVGVRFEREHGFFLTVVLFCLPAIGGTALSTVVLPSFVTVSASGGVFGIVGGYLADYHLHRTGWGEFLDIKAQPSEIVKFILYTLWDLIPILIIGVTPYVDNITSITSLFYGYLCGLAVLHKATIENKTEDDQNKRFGASMALREEKEKKKMDFVQHYRPLYFFSISFIASLFAIGLVDGESSPCAWCERTTCATFPPWASTDRQWWHCDSCYAATYTAYFMENEEDDDYNYDKYYRKYDYMLMKCPDKQVVKVDLEFYDVYDESWFKKNVRMFCHYQCNGVKQKAYYPSNDNYNYNNNRNNNNNNKNNGNNRNYNYKNYNYNNKNYNNGAAYDNGSSSQEQCNPWKSNFYTCMGYSKNYDNDNK